MRTSTRQARARGQKPPKKQPVRVRITNALQQLLRFLSLLTKLIRRLPWWADVLTVVAFCIFLYQVRVSLVPVVQPDTAISSSWLDLPVTVRNPGEFFDFKDVQFFCDMTEQQFESTSETQKWGAYNYYRLKGLVEWPIRQPPLTIQPGNTASFPCNIAANSSLMFDGVPLPMKLIHLSIKTKYSVSLGLFRWHLEGTSQTFTWKQVSGGWQWLPGETLPGPN
jgi:hypothetical protein